MIVKSIPHCCTATLVCDFGESHIAEGGNHSVKEAELLNFIIEYLSNSTPGHALVTAITNSDQKTATRILKKIGFTSTRWLSKGQHKETKVKLWWFPTESFEEAAAKWNELEELTKGTKDCIKATLRSLKAYSIYKKNTRE